MYMVQAISSKTFGGFSYLQINHGKREARQIAPSLFILIATGKRNQNKTVTGVAYLKKKFQQPHPPLLR